VVSSDVPLAGVSIHHCRLPKGAHSGQLFESSALPSMTTMTSNPLALTSKLLRGVCSRFEPPSRSSSQSEDESSKVAGLIPLNGCGYCQSAYCIERIVRTLGQLAASFASDCVCDDN
jgi:hypothetical protein